MPRAVQASLLPPSPLAHLALPSAASSWTPRTMCPDLWARSPAVPFPPKSQLRSPLRRLADASGFKISRIQRDRRTEGVWL